MFHIVDVRIKLMDDPLHSTLKAFASMELDGGLVIRDMRLMEVRRGLVVSMPSQPTRDRCHRCHRKNSLTASYCQHCGDLLDPSRMDRFIQRSSTRRLFHDHAFPTNPAARRYIEGEVIRHYHRELELTRQPGYRCRYDHEDEFQPEPCEVPS